MLSLKLNDVDTSFPRLVEGDHIMTIESAELVPSKDNDQLLNLKVAFVTTALTQSHTGEDINPGYKLTRYFPVPDENLREADKNDMFMKGLTLLALAVCGLQDTKEGKAELPEFDEAFINNMAGKQVLVKVKTSKPKEGDQYGPKSEIASVRAIPQS